MLKQGPHRAAKAGGVHVVVEDDPSWLSVYGATRDTTGRALYSAVVTLTLGVLGSTILPLPYAFSKMGITVGIITILTVASVNVTTCCMLIRAAAFTGCYSYEELAEWAGGRRGKVITQAALILLLFGTMCGGLAFLSDVALVMIHKGLKGHAPELLQQDGRPVMLLVVLVVLLPLCLQRHIRQFEKAATVGVVVVVALSSIIVYKAVTLGFPAVRNGELPLFSLKVDRHLPEAFSVLGFAFYMQPFLLPVFKELPGGAAGVTIAERAVHIVLYVSASLAYGTVGVFGAAIFGQATESNIMVNDVLQDSRATLILYAALIVYLCCGMVTTQYALRASVDTLLMGPNAPFATSRHVLQTVCNIAAAAAVACTFPTQAEKIFALTGATAVCLSCYMIPVFIHFKVQECQAASRCRNAHGSADSVGDGTAIPENADVLDAGADQRHLGHENRVLQRNTDDPASASYLNSLVPASNQAAQVGSHWDAMQVPLLDHSSGGQGHHSSFSGIASGKPWRLCQAVEAGKPWFVLAVGVGCSLAGLWVAAVDFYQTYMSAQG